MTYCIFTPALALTSTRHRALSSAAVGFGVWLVVASSGCADVVLSGENGQLRTVDTHLYAGRTTPSTPALLQGGTWCPRVECGAGQCDADDELADLAGRDLSACFAAQASAPLVADGSGCYGLSEPGTFELTYSPIQCDLADGLDLVGDTVIGEIADGTTATAVFERWVEDFVESTGDQTIGAALDGWRGEPQVLRAVVGPEVRVPVVVLEEGGRPLAFGRHQASFEFDLIEGAAPQLRYDSVEAELVLEASAPSRTAVRMTIGGDQWDVGEIIVLPEIAVQSVELVAVLGDDGVPYGVRALLRDANDHILVGGDLQWEVTGELILGSKLWSSSDHAELVSCRAPTESARAEEVHVRVELGELSDELSIDYTRAAATTATIAEWSAPPDCPIADEGCACDAGSGSGTPLVVALGLLIAPVLRRRHSTATRGLA